MKTRISLAMLLVVGLQPMVACKARRGSGSALRGDPPGALPDEAAQLPDLVPFAQNRDWGIQAPNAAGQPGGQLVPVRALTFCLDRTVLAFPMLAQAARFAVQKINASGVIWTWGEVIPCNANVQLKVETRNLGVIAGGMKVGDTTPLDSEDYPYSPSSGGGAPGGGGNPNGGGAGTLAVFIPGGAINPGQKFIANGTIAFNNDPSVVWDTTIGSEAYDPTEVALHEFGHAMRLNHKSFEFNDDTVTLVTGSMTLQAGAVVIGPGPDGKLQTVAQGDDVAKNNNIDNGPDKTVDSGKPVNLMEPFAVFGRHGVNPSGAITNNQMAQYNYSVSEIPSLRNAAAN